VKKLRTGFTTGTCAAAGAAAGLGAIINQKTMESADVVLPRGEAVKIQLHNCKFGLDWARCSVIKDGGDDPDVTHGAEIVIDVSLTDSREITIDGGHGVGIVTKPGLGLEIGKPAINPVPQKMIRENLALVGSSILAERGVRVVISVPKGKELGPKTDNPRLGILGGISILGTSGIVIPFSTASFAASIRQNIDVALAMGDSQIVLTTGGRSEEFARRIIDLPDHCFVQMGDFAGYAMQQSAKKGASHVAVAGFIGKMAKLAKGTKQTHVKGSKVDMKFLADVASRCGAGALLLGRIRAANTARHVLEIVKESALKGFFDELAKLVQKQMASHAESKVPVSVLLFDFDGSVLADTMPA